MDEFDLPKRHQLEPGCAPDYGLLWEDRVWMVELKTERASHRPAQLLGYFELAAYRKGAQTQSCSPPVFVEQATEQVSSMHDALAVLADEGQSGGGSGA